MRFTWPNTVIEIAVIGVLALLVRGLLKRLINRAVSRAAKHAEEQRATLTGRAADVLARAGGIETTRQANRTRTLGTMLVSLTDAVLLIVVVFTVLQSLNVNIMPALASAGIGGIAIGFGAQSLIKDVISGIFVIMEDQFGVGDYINVGSLEGTVQSVGLRVTCVQDPKGEIWYVRNGEIATLGNKSQGWSTSYIAIPANITEDPFRVIELLGQLCTALDEEPVWRDRMLEPPQVLGLTSFDATQATYTVMTKCPANQQWDIEREVRARALVLFRQAGVRSPSQIVQSVTEPAAPPSADSVARAAPSDSPLTRQPAGGTEHSPSEHDARPGPGDESGPPRTNLAEP